jgi:hypothetical protein
VRKSWRIVANAIPAYKWPQTPMQVKLGIWSVSNGSDPGTVVWAGGLPDWNGRDAEKNPYRAYFKTLELEDYSGGCNETQKGAEIEYLYNERTNGWQNIQVKGCVKRIAPGAYPPPLPSSSIGSQPSQTNGDGGSASTNSSGVPSQTGEQNPTGSDGSGDDSDSAALPSRRLSSPLGAVIFLLWLLTI